MVVRFWIGGTRKIWLIERNLKEKILTACSSLLYISPLISGALGKLIWWYLWWVREGGQLKPDDL